MADNAQKIDFSRSVVEAARAIALQHIQNSTSGTIPATIKSVDKTGTIATVKPEVEGAYNLPMLTVSIHGDEFTRRPWKEGDKGTLTAHAVGNGNMTGLRAAANKSSFTQPGNLSSMIWKPVGNAKFKPALDPTAHETYGRDGGTISHDGTAKSLVKTHATKGTSTSSGGDGTGADGPHAMTTHPTEGTKIASTVAHVLGAPNASLDKDGNQTNQGSSTSKGNITSSSGNISAPSGSVSGQSGSFASGSIGGLAMLAGVLSGGGGGGSPAVSIDTNAGTIAVAQYIQTQPLTFATLPAATAALVGARACITDSSVSTFLSAAAGGGTTCVPVFCQQVTGGTTTYRWVVG